MLLLNYLARKGAESGMVAGLTISVPWDAQESSNSMEEPLNWLLFNKHLTNGLCRAMTRSVELQFFEIPQTSLTAATCLLTKKNLLFFVLVFLQTQESSGESDRR